MKTIPHWIVAVAKNICADPDIRLNLSGVHVTNDFIEATDSFVAVRLELPKTDAERYPTRSERIESLGEEGITIPANMLKDVKFKANKLSEILDKQAILIKSPEGTQTLEVTDLDNTVSYNARLINAQFPKIDSFYDSIIESEAKDKIRVSIEFLENVINVYKAMGQSSVTIHTRSNSGVIVAPGEGMEKSFAIVMPLKI